MNRTLETMQASLLVNVEDILTKHERNGTSSKTSIPDGISCKSLKAVIESITGDDQTDQGDYHTLKDSLTHIVDLAKTIANGEQTHLNEPNDKEILWLENVFSHLNNLDGQMHLLKACDDYRIESPSQVDSDDMNDDYRQLSNRWMKMCDNYIFDASHSNALIDSIEACFSDVPSSQNSLAERGVSLYHQSKATAAMACCIERWLKQKDIQDYRKALVENRSAFMKEKVFLLYSLDLSGIQTFIYTISNKGALKGLRVRSFYLSIMMEHIADMILEASGLFRTNLIYSGGGRAHLLLPNDDQCFGHAEETVALVNQFFMERFGTSLFLARGYVEATASELSSENGESGTISELFRTASAGISQQKLQRYNAEEIITLNEKKDSHSTERECVICGQSGRLIPHGDGEMICETCDALEKFSNTLTQDRFFLAVYRTKVDNSLPLPGGMWLARINDKALQNESIAMDDNIVRVYSINGEFAPLPKTIHLRMGNYRAVNEDATSMTFEQLANASKGVKRLGVLRADVDNLGALFATGLIDPDDEHPYRYATLPRYMALSAALTKFFQQEINRIVEEGNETWLVDGEVSKQRHVSIVYSGGDDVFLIGAWNEVLDATIALQNAFRRYTGGRVTLSAGFGMFPQHEPVGIMAQATADLEEEAKMIADGTKNAISLFGSVGGDSSFTFHWHDFRHAVLKEKVSLLNRLYFNRGDDEQQTGNAFLYQVLSLLREVRKEPIAVARLAYLLARHAPDKKRVSEEQAELYNEFSRNVYKWAMEPEENKALQAAILLHVYAHRKEQDSDV